ncbi:MAG: single-stranded-DNA-specific exonuclease RecJ [Hungatella sp.]
MMNAKWMLYAKKADFRAISEKYGISPVTARILRNREVTSEAAINRYLCGTMADLHSPHLLKDADKAVTILQEKIATQKRIRIVGDYDIDGVCATYLLYRALMRVGAAVDYEIPDRIRDGYGINESIIEAAAADGIDTILTCDNGIAARDQIGLAKELGMTVIITDHHDILHMEGQEVLPPADAIVNAKQESCQYPWKEICGAVTAYQLIRILYEVFEIPLSEWEELLEFAAIATVGDVMKLQEENRIIVKEGLKRIPQTKSVGLRTLIEKNHLDIHHLSAYHIGFVIGPCLNAGGRLQTAKLALSLLLCQEEDEAERLAAELKELNDLRKEMTADSLEKAVRLVEADYMQDAVLVVLVPDCHESLAGIIAGRLRERYHKPTFVLTEAEGCVKGSGRSIEAYSMFEALVEVQDLLLRFGGHPMAAGLSIAADQVETLRRLLNQNAKLTEEDFIPKIWIDVPMPLEYVTEPLIEELERLEPYGQGNEKPKFAQKNLQSRSTSVLGKNRNAIKMSLVSEQGTVMDAMLFRDGDAFMQEKGAQSMLDIIYYPVLHEYNGNRSLQIIISEYQFPQK